MIKKLIEAIKRHIHGLCWGYPTPCRIMSDLTFVKIAVIYPININRQHCLYKEWNVAVNSVQPDERFETHAAWMLHIISERAYTIAIIAEMEHVQQRQKINSFKEFGIYNRRTIQIKK